MPEIAGVEESQYFWPYLSMEKEGYSETYLFP